MTTSPRMIVDSVPRYNKSFPSFDATDHQELIVEEDRVSLAAVTWW